MNFDGFDFSLVLLFLGMGVAAVRVLYDEFCQRDDKDEDMEPPQLTDNETPALPAHGSGPYRSDSGESNDGGAAQDCRYEGPDDEELFRRFVYAHSHLIEKINSDEFRRLAGEINAEILLDSIETDAPGSEWERAAIFALSIRTDFDDVAPLLDIVTFGECVEARLAALEVLGNRTPPEEQAVAAVIKLAFGEIVWDSDDNDIDGKDAARLQKDEELLQKEAKKVLKGWEESHPQVMLEFVSRR